MVDLLKLTPAEQRRLDRLRAKAESRIRQALDQYIRIVTVDAVLRTVIQLLEQGNDEALMSMIEEQVVVTSNVLSDVFIEAGKDMTEEAKQAIQTTFPSQPAVGIGFDPTYPDAVTIMRRNKLEFVREYTAKQREATRLALANALQSGAGPIDAARAFRDSIGLTAHQQAAVLNYRRLLEEGSREALDRDLRDRRYDRTVARSIDQNIPLTKEQIDRMVERYRQRFLTYRAEVIARTETTRVLSQARRNAVRQAMEQAGIRDDQVRRIWGTNLDNRERWTHHEMNAQEVVGLDSHYRSPSGALIQYPGDPEAPTEEIIQCRCYESFRFVTK